MSINHRAPWYYVDPQCIIQGPFGGDEMRHWFEAGFFMGDLPISQSCRGPFRTLNYYQAVDQGPFQFRGDGNHAAARMVDQGPVQFRGNGNHAAARMVDHRKRERGGKSGRRKRRRDTRYILSAVVPPTVLQEVSPTDLLVMPLQAFTSENEEEEDDVLHMLNDAELVDEVVSLTHSLRTGAKMIFAKMLWVNLGQAVSVVFFYIRSSPPPPHCCRHFRDRRYLQTHCLARLPRTTRLKNHPREEFLARLPRTTRLQGHPREKCPARLPRTKRLKGHPLKDHPPYLTIRSMGTTPPWHRQRKEILFATKWIPVTMTSCQFFVEIPIARCGLGVGVALHRCAPQTSLLTSKHPPAIAVKRRTRRSRLTRRRLRWSSMNRNRIFLTSTMYIARCVTNQARCCAAQRAT
jgi:hypothetical protein